MVPRTPAGVRNKSRLFRWLPFSCHRLLSPRACRREDDVTTARLTHDYRECEDCNRMCRDSSFSLKITTLCPSPPHRRTATSNRSG